MKNEQTPPDWSGDIHFQNHQAEQAVKPIHNYEYICSMLEQLKNLADRSEDRFLVYLIDQAHLYVKERIEKNGDLLDDREGQDKGLE